MGDQPKRIKWTRELFIEKAKEKHGDKFDYSKVEFKGFCTKVLIKCNDCGEEFSQTPLQHLKTMYACPTCFYRCRRDGRKLPFEQVLKEMTEKHQGRYTYEGAEEYYKNTESKIPITCPIHGVFWQSVHSHKAGIGCPKCGKQKSSAQIRISWEEFLRRAREKHGDKYEYNQEEYTKVSDSLNIRCRTCGKTFRQKATCHLRGQGCPYCAHNAPLTKEEYIKKANEVHNGKYSYGKVVYRNATLKVCITCKEHGDFWQVARSHLDGQGCPSCYRETISGVQKMTYDDFIKKASVKNKDDYDYSIAKTQFGDGISEIPIICKRCGEIFMQKPIVHIAGQGCPRCGLRINHGVNKKLTREQFIKRAKFIHGDKYDYSDVVYVNSNTKVNIFCRTCQKYFAMAPHNHIRASAQGCPLCANQRKGAYAIKEFKLRLEEFKQKHGDTYTYEGAEEYYKNSTSKIPIRCPLHGIFWQSVAQHKKGHGCPLCLRRTLEERVSNFLKELDIEYIREQTFDWLVYRGHLRLDFYLPQYGIAVECQGRQHFEPVDFGGKGEEWAIEKLIELQDKDRVKKEKCEEHGLTMLYYNHSDDFPEFSMKLINEIKKRDGK